MNVAITGASGLIGKAVAALLRRKGHNVTPLVRKGSARSGVRWDPVANTIDLAGLEGVDAVIHLAGEPIAGLWTEGKRRRIRESRVGGTELIATSLGKLRHTPTVLVSASAVGFYGNRRSDDSVDETSEKGQGFLADVVDEWERAALPASQAGIRVVHPRFGLVLSGKGGSLGAMLPIFRLGLGGRIGSGRQAWSWVAIDDVAGAVVFSLGEAVVSGPVNVTAPQTVTNAEFTEVLGKALQRPTVFPVPAPLLELVAGDMARELLLSGARVVPRKLQSAGYVFEYPELAAALGHVLGHG